jgi:hypothetical protein
MYDTPQTQRSSFLSGAVITSIFLGILVLVFGSIMIWALVNYNDAKNSLDIKKQQAAQVARDDQKTKDQAIFDEKEKDPLKEFVGPEDLGRVSFKYPKTWSVYVDSIGGGGTAYQAYLNPNVVPSTQGQNKFALRVSIISQGYNQVLEQYAGLVKQGKLRSAIVTTSGYDGTRLDGSFSQTVQGSAVIFKIRDKTLVLRTDSPSFQTDFDNIVKTLDFKQ